MKSRFVTAAASIALAGCLGRLAVVHAAPPRADIPVTVTIADTQNLYPMHVQSDVQGAYVNTKQVQSLILNGGGEWALTTYYGRNFTPSNRTMFFDLTEPVSFSNPPAPIGTAYVQSHLIAKCALVNVDLMKIKTGAPAQCPGSFRFQAPSGLWYRFSFQPANFPEVNYMKVACIESDATGCKTWTISPSGSRLTGTDPNPKNLNKLVQIDPGSDAVIADLGDYYLSFYITVAR